MSFTSKKTQEHEFVERLEREFEISPRLSRGVLDVVTETFFDDREIGAGQSDVMQFDDN